MVRILIESTTGQIVRNQQAGSHSRPQQRAAAFGVVHFWPLQSTIKTSYCSCFRLGFGFGIVAICCWFLYISDSCDTDFCGSGLQD